VSGGAVQVFFSGLCCGGYGIVEMVGGCGPFFSLLSSVFRLLLWRAVVCGRLHFFLYIFIWVYFGISVDSVFYKLLSFVLICYRWWRKGTDQEGYEPLLEQTQLEHRRLDLETRIEEYESDVRALKDNHVMLEDGEKKDAIFSEICSLDSQIFQLKSELATVISLLSAYD